MSDQKTVEQLQEELNAANDKIASLEASNAYLSDENTSLHAEVKRLIETPDAKESDNGVGKTFDYSGTKYKVLTPAIRLPNIGRVTANDILGNEKAQQWLVENKSGAIAEVK